MNFTFNKYWLFIAICIIGNILIFTFLSNKLESYVSENITEKKILYE